MSKKQKGTLHGKLLRRGDSGYSIGTKSARASVNTYSSYGAKYYSRGSLIEMCPATFERATGIKLNSNEEVMVKITIETTPIKKVKK